MKKFILIAIAFCGTLVADFRKEFLDEVLTFSKMNPAELVDEQVDFIESFYDSSYIEMVGNDADFRSLFVTAQGDFERTIAHLLKEEKILGAIGFIHTPTPATPLCTKGEVNSELVDSTLENDSKRLYTVMKRPEIIREFLKNKGLLVICYPESGRNKRTEQQLGIFQEAKDQFANLKDVPMEIDQLDPELIGATYIIRTNDNEMYAFAIMARQANAPEDDSTWAIWFGSEEDEAVDARVTKVLNYLKPSLNPNKSKL